MRWLSALGLCVCVMGSCTARNPAYAVSGGDSTVGTDKPGTSGSGVSTSSSADSGSATEAPGTTHGSTSAATTTTGTSSTTGVDTEDEVRCWSTPIVLTEELPDADGLSNIPVRISLSGLAPVFRTETLRFYQAGQVLAHEVEAPGGSAWVRLPQLSTAAGLEFEAVAGAACPDALRPPDNEVWSEGYVAVFHFDNGERVPLTFSDSVSGIELLGDADTGVAEARWGPHLTKSTNAPLAAFDPVLNISGTNPVSVLGWVSLDALHAGVLPWRGDPAAARHRELIAKIPGYRLIAVGGETGEGSAVPTRPFFNLPETIPGQSQDNVFGFNPVPPATWTMLAGTYNGAIARLYVDGVRINQLTTIFTPGANLDDELRVGLHVHGGIDEIRVSNVARSDEWVAVQHASMTDSLFTLGKPVEFERP